MYQDSEQEEFVLYPLQTTQNLSSFETSHNLFVEKVLSKEPIPSSYLIDPCYQMGQQQRQQLKQYLLSIFRLVQRVKTPISKVANSATQLIEILKGNSTEEERLKIWIQIRKNMEESDNEGFTQILNLFSEQTIKYVVDELLLFREKRITEEILRIIFLFTFRKQGDHLLSYFTLDFSYLTTYLVSKVPIIAKLAILCLSNIINILPSDQVSQITLSQDLSVVLNDMRTQSSFQNFYKQNELCFLWFIYHAYLKGQPILTQKHNIKILSSFIWWVSEIQNVNDFPLFAEGLRVIGYFIQKPNKSFSKKMILKRSIAPKFIKVFSKILEQVQSEDSILQTAQIITFLSSYTAREQLQSRVFIEALLKFFKHPNIAIKVEGCKAVLNAVKIQQLGELIVSSEKLVDEILTLFIYGPYETKYYLVDIIPQLLAFRDPDLITTFKERNILTHYLNILSEETHELALIGIIQLISQGEKQAGNPEQGQQGNPVIKQIHESGYDLSQITSYRNHPIFSNYVNVIMDNLNLGDPKE